MPLWDSLEVKDLLGLASLHCECRECGHITAMDYCENCDQYYWIHLPGCTMYEPLHFGHRLTLVPYIAIAGEL